MDISKILKKRYDRKFSIYGSNIKSLGWDNQRNQYKRFEIAIKDLDINKNTTILDIGCGFGDFLTFLKKKKIKFKNYLGVDLNSNFVKNAKKRNSNKIKFKQINFYKNNFFYKFDYVFMIGMTNYNFRKDFDNLIFLKKLLFKGFKISKKAFIFDFISSLNLKKDKKEKFIYYYNPKDVLKICQKITNSYQIRHDYRKIPKKECNIKLFK